MNRYLLKGIFFVACIFLTYILFTCVAYADAKEYHHHAMEEKESHDMAREENQNIGICPVMREKAGEKYSYIHEGRSYYFCCPICIEQFKKDPQGYISKIKEINLEAFQFGFSPEKITVKKGDIVKISAASRDVTHGIYIKGYNINTPLKKGEVKNIEFIADKSGEFDILCSVYCGRGHNDMKAKLAVED